MGRDRIKSNNSSSHNDLLIKKDSEIKRLKKQLFYLKKHYSKDPLTNTLNKINGLRRLQIEINKSQINKTPTTIAFIDVDDMKSINDNYGHCVGDDLLLTLGNLISANIRKWDFVFRFGGDEFVIVFSDTDKDQATSVLKRIEKKIEIFNKSKENIFNIDISYGINEYKGEEKIKIYNFLDSADINMYEHKKMKKFG